MPRSSGCAASPPAACPADIVATARNLDGGPFFGFGVAALIGLDAAHPELHLSNYLNATGQQLVAAHQNDCLVGLVAAFALKRYSDITTTDVLALPDWQAAFAESRLGSIAPRVPILQYHGLIDEVIPYAVGRNLRNEWCSRGVAVEFDTYLAEHATGVVAGRSRPPWSGLQLASPGRRRPTTVLLRSPRLCLRTSPDWSRSQRVVFEPTRRGGRAAR